MNPEIKDYLDSVVQRYEKPSKYSLNPGYSMQIGLMCVCKHHDLPKEIVIDYCKQVIDVFEWSLHSNVSLIITLTITHGRFDYLMSKHPQIAIPKSVDNKGHYITHVSYERSLEVNKILVDCLKTEEDVVNTITAFKEQNTHFEHQSSKKDILDLLNTRHQVIKRRGYKKPIQ